MATYFNLDKRTQLRLLAAALMVAAACGGAGSGGGSSAGGGGGGGDGSTQSNVAAATNVPVDYAAAYSDLRDCLASYGVSSQDFPPAISYVPTVTCVTGAQCCISPNRGGEEDNGIAVLPSTCDQPAGYLAHAYAHEALHTVIGDPCHTSPLWQECWDSSFHAGCTAT